jgi:hypothetical protein
MKVWMSALFSSLLLTSLTLAQMTAAILKGTVVDRSAAAVASASVAATNESTGQVRSTTSDVSDLFSLPNFPPGTYIQRWA